MTSPFPAGPFFEVWKRSRLLREDRPLISAREAMFIDLPWGLPFLISLAEGNASGPYAYKP